MASGVTVVVVDGDQRTRRFLRSALRHSGYLVESARDARQAVSLLRRRVVGAILVEPEGADPAGLVRCLRLRTDIPIIVVSGPSDQDGKIALLDAGADDVVAKPVGMDELLARLRAALRRSPRRTADEPVVVTDAFTVDLTARRVHRTDGTEVQLTPIEWRITESLVRRPGRVVEHGQLLDEVWGPDAHDKPHYLRVHLAAIRRKLEPVPHEPRFFLTYAGLGHMFSPR
jgi:two-component system KDP operon response regulator KdpE